MEKLKRLFSLNPLEIIYLIPALLLLIISKLAIIIIPFNSLQKNFQKLTKSKAIAEVSEKETNLKVNSINRIAYAFPFLGFSCLPKALALKFWLKNYANITVNFGVQKDQQNQLIAHAWVSNTNKIILGEDPSVNFKSIWVWQ
jgi:Transglutaminase-like superfamily